jgi:hypothetical protein
MPGAPWRQYAKVARITSQFGFASLRKVENFRYKMNLQRGPCVKEDARMVCLEKNSRVILSAIKICGQTLLI